MKKLMKIFKTLSEDVLNDLEETFSSNKTFRIYSTTAEFPTIEPKMFKIEEKFTSFRDIIDLKKVQLFPPELIHGPAGLLGFIVSVTRAIGNGYVPKNSPLSPTSLIRSQHFFHVVIDHPNAVAECLEKLKRSKGKTVYEEFYFQYLTRYLTECDELALDDFDSTKEIDMYGCMVNETHFVFCIRINQNFNLSFFYCQEYE